MVHPLWVPLKTEGGSHGVITTDNSLKEQLRWACWVGHRLLLASSPFPPVTFPPVTMQHGGSGAGGLIVVIVMVVVLNLQGRYNITEAGSDSGGVQGRRHRRRRQRVVVVTATGGFLFGSASWRIWISNYVLRGVSRRACTLFHGTSQLFHAPPFSRACTVSNTARHTIMRCRDARP